MIQVVQNSVFRKSHVCKHESLIDLGAKIQCFVSKVNNRIRNTPAEDIGLEIGC